MSVGDVKIEKAPIGHAVLRIDIGGGHELYVHTSHNTDDYTDVTVQWHVPAHVTGPAEQVRARKARQWRWLFDKRQGKTVDRRTQTWGRDKGKVPG